MLQSSPSAPRRCSKKTFETGAANVRRPVMASAQAIECVQGRKEDFLIHRASKTALNELAHCSLGITAVHSSWQALKAQLLDAQSAAIGQGPKVTAATTPAGDRWTHVPTNVHIGSANIHCWSAGDRLLAICGMDLSSATPSAFLSLAYGPPESSLIETTAKLISLQPLHCLQLALLKPYWV